MSPSAHTCIYVTAVTQAGPLDSFRLVTRKNYMWTGCGKLHLQGDWRVGYEKILTGSRELPSWWPQGGAGRAQATPSPNPCPMYLFLLAVFPLGQTDKHRVLPELCTFFWTITDLGRGSCVGQKSGGPWDLQVASEGGQSCGAGPSTMGSGLTLGRKSLKWMNCGDTQLVWKNWRME